MRNQLFAGAALLALSISTTANAQSAGSIDFESVDTGEEIVITGTRVDDGVGGVQIPQDTKATVVLNSEIIQRQRPGQTINDIINLVPGVSFQNNDPYGSSGGGFRIRGFDSSRISQTLDGIPLNDSGNYAIYTNQQVDPEILDSVSVNLGATDVDSPTASAVGGTINLRTRVPGDDLGAMFSASYGEYEYHRVFGMLDSGDITGFGTKAFASASYTTYNNPFNNYGTLEKQQYNGRIYQEIGSNGDFVSVAGHYNENRNNFFGSLPLRDVEGATVGTGSNNRFPRTFEEAQYTILYPCQTDAPQTGVRDVPNGCGNEFDRRYNPSNTGNVRGSSRFTLADGLIFTFEPSYQYTKANGGGVGVAREGSRIIGGVPYYGFIGGQYYYGADINGDGDTIDTCLPAGANCGASSGITNGTAGVRMLNPSQTQTKRYIVISNLAYELNEDNRVRISYTFDRARHRQTGETGLLQLNGEPFDVFPINDPITDVNGNIVQKRDRRSFATLHQVSGDYRGSFLDDSLVVRLGVRVPFFTRDLQQNCFTTAANGNVDCISPAQNGAYAAANPAFAGPQEREYDYNKVLPNVGFTYNFTPQFSAFGSYAAGLSVPGTDTLYSAIFFPVDTAEADPEPETTDSFDLGLRFNSGIVTAQATGFYINFENRIATAFDTELGENISRNLGQVTRWGFDGSISVQPIPEVLAYVFGSYLNSEIQDDLLGGTCTAANVTGGVFGCTAAGTDYFLPTGGKQESGISEWSFGGRLQGNLGPVEIGGQVKYTGPRFINDVNLALTPLVGGAIGPQIYPARADGYTIVDLDARVSLAEFGLENTFFQLNVSNLFNQFYVGYVAGSAGNTGTAPFVQLGAPRAVSGSVVIGF